MQAYSRLNLDFPVALREFAIASAGVADSLGILVADVASLFIQVSLVTLCIIVYSNPCTHVVFFLSNCCYRAAYMIGMASKEQQ